MGVIKEINFVINYYIKAELKKKIISLNVFKLNYIEFNPRNCRKPTHLCLKKRRYFNIVLIIIHIDIFLSESTSGALDKQ